MKAIVFNTPGDASVLHVEERELPVYNDNEVLIKVMAAGINRPDIIQRRGKYPAPKGIVQDILGLEVSGIIEQVGSNVKNLKLGQEVCALITGGGYAEYVVAHQGSCLPIPQGITLQDAAALPEVLFTVWHNIFQRGGLKKGDDVLIYGGSGGIGSMAIQLVTLFGANAHTLVSSPEKEEYCRSLGAKKVVNYKEQNILEALGNSSIDLILDSVGGEYLDINLDLLRADGRLVYINAMEGAKPPINIIKVMQKRLNITGSTLRAREVEFKAELAADIFKNAYPLIESKGFKSMVEYRFPMAEAAKAHALMDSRDFNGKIILTL